jgi:hypothetical protein
MVWVNAACVPEHCVLTVVSSGALQHGALGSSTSEVTYVEREHVFHRAIRPPRLFLKNWHWPTISRSRHIPDGIAGWAKSE